MSGFSKMLISQEFFDWTENWEKNSTGRMKNSQVVEARFLTKYKNLSYEYDNGWISTSYEGNCEFRHWMNAVCQLIGNCAGNDVENEPFAHFLQSPWFRSFNRAKVSMFTSLHLEVLKRDSMTQMKIYWKSSEAFSLNF